MERSSFVCKTISKPVAYPPVVVVPHVHGSLVGQVGLHPHHFDEAMPFLQPLSSGTVDLMPEQPIGRWAVFGAFVEACSHSIIVANKNGIASCVPEGLQNGSGFSPGDSLLPR